MTMDLPMMDYEKEIQRALLCLQINRGYEIPSENEILDARQHPVQPQAPAPFVNLNAQLEEHEATLRREQELLQIADSDDNEETVDVDDDDDEEDEDNSGSESVHDYFSYSSGYPQNFMNIQTLPINLQGAKRLDRCSSNDSGLGTSSLSPSHTTKQTNSNSEEETSSEPKRRFPKLGISSLSIKPANTASSAIPAEINTSTASSSSASSSPPSSDNDESLVEDKLRTSTPQHSPTKPLELSGTEGGYVPSDWPEDQPLPTVEDLLYPGIKYQANSSPSRFTKNSKKILSGFKTRTSTGLLKLKSTVTDMMKTEREEAALQQQVFERITKTAADEDDFSIHMIKEASLQRLTETAQAQSKDSTTQMGVFPPSGGRLRDNNTAVVRPPRRSHNREKSTPSPRHRAKKTHRLDVKSLEEQKRHKRNRKMITEVRRRVHEAHKRVQIDETHKPSKVPAAYRSDRTKQPVYTRGGQVPQFRNGELDWNYLWFFSDSSSATTNSTTNSSNPGDLSQLTTNQTVISNEFCSSASSASSSTDSSIIEEKPRLTVTPPPTAVGSPPSRNIKPSPQPVLRHATKKRIRKLTVNPPTEDSMTLLGMV